MLDPGLDDRVSRLDAPHVGPLMECVRDMRKGGFDGPNVDPNDGGIHARVLILMNTPGRRAVRSTFVSCDNPDESARNMKKMLLRSGLSRDDVCLWNVVPYYVSTETKNAETTRAMVEGSRDLIERFIGCFYDLRVILFCGTRAERSKEILNITGRIHLLWTFHTGAQSFNNLDQRRHIEGTFSAAKLLSSEPITYPRLKTGSA